MKKPAKKATSQKNTSKTIVSHFSTLYNDFRSSILVVSLLFNAFVFIAWIVLRVTNNYDQQVLSFLFNR